MGTGSEVAHDTESDERIERMSSTSGEFGNFIVIIFGGFWLS